MSFLTTALIASGSTADVVDARYSVGAECRRVCFGMPRPVRLFVSSIPSGNAYKIELLLAQLGVTVDVVMLDILATPSETRRPEFLARNPNGRIPVIELVDGSHLAESNAILYYLSLIHI